MTDTEFRIILHQRLCAVADLLMEHYDPCEWRDGLCKKGISDCCHHTGYERRDGSGGCFMMGPDGCTVQNLGCKLWFCTPEVWDHLDHKYKRTLKALEVIARIYCLSSFEPEHYCPGADEYRTDELLRTFND